MAVLLNNLILWLQSDYQSVLRDSPVNPQTTLCSLDEYCCLDPKYWDNDQLNIAAPRIKITF